MGGTMKMAHGHGHNMHGAYYSSGGGGGGSSGGGGIRRRWNNMYLVTVIMLLVFGGGVLGVMGLHRVRDRRIFSLLLKEKDDQIFNLQLLLQKEREQVQEVKNKAEELKMKIYNLQAQKGELSGRILEMESTISSLKDEQKTIESALQENQNEAKSLRDRFTEAMDENPRVKALTEALQQKEAEIEDLRHQLQFPTKVWSVSSDDPSIQTPPKTPMNANVSSSETATNQDANNNRDVQEFHSREERKKQTGDAQSSRNGALRYQEADGSTHSDKQGENGRLLEGRREVFRSQQSGELSNSQENGAENGKTGFDRADLIEQTEKYDLDNGDGFQTGKKREYKSETEMVENVRKVGQDHREEAGQTHFTNVKDLSTERDSKVGRVSNSNSYYYHGSRIHKGGVKMEIQGNPKNRSYKLGWKHSNLKRAKGKIWVANAKAVDRNLNSKGNEAEISRNNQLVKGTRETANIIEEGNPMNQVKIQNLDVGVIMQNETLSNNELVEIHEKLPGGGQGAKNNDGKNDNNEEPEPQSSVSTDTNPVSQRRVTMRKTN